jgi:hypothetical protein
VRQYLGLALTFGLVGCDVFTDPAHDKTEQLPPPPPAAVTSASPAARPVPEPAGPSLEWHSSLAGDAILVELTDPTSHYRVEKVELVALDGARLATAELTREVERRYGFGPDGGPTGVGVNIFGSTSTGVGVSIGGGQEIGMTYYEGQPRTLTRARLVVPDLAAYGVHAKSWRIAIELLDSTGETSFVAIPAPTP